MKRYRWSYLFTAALLGVGAAVLIFSLLTLPSQALAGTHSDRAAEQAVADVPSIHSVSQAGFPQAPSRALPDAPDPRTLTAPRSFRPPVRLPTNFRMESNAPSGSDPAMPAALNPQSLPPGLTVDLTYNVVMGWVGPGDTVTLTTAAGYGAAVADDVGFFWTPLWHADGYAAGIVAGEPIAIYVNGALAFTVTPPEISGGLDVLADTVAGMVAGDSGGTAVAARMGAWAQPPSPGAPVVTGTTTVDGSFTLPFTGVDLGAENLVAADVIVDGVTVRRYLYPDPPVFLAQQYNLIAGYAPVWQPVTATVYMTYPSDVRWSGVVSADPPHGYYNFWDVAMEVGDIIVVELEGGVSLSIPVIALGSLSFDVDMDQLQGTAPDGATLRASLWQWQDGDRVYHQTHATAGVGDQFTLTFAVDLRPRDGVDVVFIEANGNQFQLSSGPPYVTAWDDLYSNLDCVYGRLDGPGLPITVSLTTPDQTYVRTTGMSSDAGNQIVFCFLIRDPDFAWGPIEFNPGDIATLSSPTWQGDVEIAEVDWQADTAANSLSGEAPDGDLEITVSQWNDWGYPLYGAATQVAVAASPFTAAFSSFDVRDGNQVSIAHFDPVTGYANETAAWGRPALPYFELHLPYGMSGMVAHPDEPVTASLYDENHVWLAETSHDHDGDPWRFWLDNFDGYPLQPGYWITLTSESGWTAGMEIPYLAIDGDPDTDLLTGDAPTGLLYLDGGRWDSGFGAFVPGPPVFLNTALLGHDLQRGDDVALTYQALSGNRARRGVRLGEVHRVEFWLDPAGLDWIWGAAKEGAVVTITTPHDQVVVWADPACGGCWNIPEPIELNPGDMVTVAAAPGLFPVTIPIPDPITAEADSDLDQVWGQVGGRAEDWLEVHGYWDGGYRETQTDVDGYFSVAYDDLPRGGRGHIRFGGWIDYTEVYIHQNFQTPDLILRVNYAHEWVEGNYEAGHSIWITLTDSMGDLKATASGETGPIPWWGGQSGFSTSYNVPWQGQQPDIQQGDWVYAALDNGQTSMVQIGVIDGVLDVDNDTVSGAVHAPWFSELLNGGCGVWVENGVWMSFTVDPDGGAYLCDFGALGWDLQPGQMVGVEYLEPDGDSVINVFEEPAPRLMVQKWADGQPGEGGNFVFHIQYRNEGGALAEDVVITDTMQGFAYLNDTGGFPFTTGVTPGGDPYVAWELGSVEPGDWLNFDLFVAVTAVAGDPVRNTVQIATSNPYNTSDPWQLENVWEGQVVENDTHLGVGKGAWTWNPAPGYDFVYNVNVCNHGSSGSTEVTLTDTLPLSTTLVGWWGQDPGWQEVDSGPHLLVVERPTIAGWTCNEVYIRVHLDETAWPGMELVNTAEISAANDLSPDDNQATLWHNVGEPHYNLGVNLSWHWGMLVPGGHLRYGLHLNNHGNLPVTGPVRITDTLPAGTVFHGWHSWGWADVSLIEVTDTHVVWELDGFENGYYAGIELALDIDPGVAPGTLLINRAEITTPPGDTDPANNVSYWEETVYAHGPNLRLRKEADWHGHGEGHNAWYRLEVENVGDQPVQNVTVTDHYPPEMVLDGGVNVGYWQWWSWADHPGEHYFTVTLEVLEPTWRVDIHYNTLIPGDDPVPPGLVLTNAADVTLPPNDTNPDDNSATRTLFTGPDLYIEKDLAAGVFLPGEVITYHLRFGNSQVGHAWWWNPQGQVWITDTLPEGMSYVAAYQLWCGSPYPDWCERPPDVVDGQNLLWQHWLGSSHWNELLLVVQIDEAATGLDTYSNWAKIGSDQPDVDIEPFYENNLSGHEGAIALPYFTIGKSYASSRIAGLPVTYTLTVENPGHAAGSGLLITDALPANLTYLSGGSYDPATNVVSWSESGLPAGESLQVQFVARLGHSGEVVNDQYRVAASDEGVLSAWGTPLSFTILPPTIDAYFTQSATNILVGEAVTFTDASSTNGAPIVAWDWDFGDGQTSAQQNPTHTYTAAGVYTVTLQVTDSVGYTAVYTVTNAVTVDIGMTYIFLPVLPK